MIKSKKSQSVIILIIAGVTFSVLGKEHDLVKEELQFRIGQEEQKWITDLDELEGIYQEDKAEKSVIKPTHVSIMIIEHPRVPRIYWTEISNNPIGRTMSKQQKEFIAEANGRIRNLKRKEEGFEFRWYAVSQEDAQKMAQAFINVWNAKVDKKLLPLLDQRKGLEEKITEIKKILPEKQKQLEEAEKKYKEVKDARYYMFNDGQAYEKARETIIKIENTLDLLEIELAGIKEKITAIIRYRHPGNIDGPLKLRTLSDLIKEKLNQMYIEQMIELRSVEARQKAALLILDREKNFLNLFNQWNNLKSEVATLRRNLNSSENYLPEVEKKLANRIPERLPPKVLQNQVTIYPVK
jgi:hypothetical protein